MSIKYKNYYITSFPAKDEYKCRLRKNKKLEPFSFLTRKGFKKLKNEHDDIQVTAMLSFCSRSIKKLIRSALKTKS